MLFRKKVARSCSYCQYSTKIGEDEYLCTKKGLISGLKACRKFCYDPCKRVPVKAKPLDFGQYKKEDFTL